MRKPLIAGNWKMYKTAAAGIALAREIAEGLRPNDPEVIVFPPATALHDVAQAVKGTPVKVGGQNMHFAREGAFTGEISSLMLQDAGCTHVLLGHSERRHVFGELGGQLLPAQAIAECDGDGPLGAALPDDVPVELGNDFPGRQRVDGRGRTFWKGDHSSSSVRLPLV